MRITLIAFILLLGVASTRAAETAAPERGVAITDPATLRKLDQERFELGRMLLPQQSSNVPLANAELFALPSMVPVREALDREFDRYIARHRANLPKETIGVGAGFDFQLFDRTLLGSSDARFVLAGSLFRILQATIRDDTLFKPTEGLRRPGGYVGC